MIGTRFWLVSLLFSSIALGQDNSGTLADIQASLTLEKQQYLIGEPVMLVFHARNTGKIPISLSSSDPYSLCSGYRVTVDPKEPDQEPLSGPSCAPLFSIEATSCLSGGFTLEPGQEREQNVLLNRFQRFNQPGVYTIQATSHLSDARNWGNPNQPTRPVSGTFAIGIKAPSSSDELKAVFAPYVEDLQTGSSDRRREAALALATLPAPFLESPLLEMLNNADLQIQAIDGLHRLNTKRARVALLGLLQKDDQFTFEQQHASEALADMKDTDYGSALLTLWKTSLNPERKAKLLVSAARLDPAAELPVIQQQLESSQEEEREAGMNALAATEQQEALSRLVQGITDPSPRVRQAAAAGLVSLTRVSPSGDGMYWSGDDPSNDARFWSSWLHTHTSSPVHLLRECPQITEPHTWN